MREIEIKRLVLRQREAGSPVLQLVAVVEVDGKPLDLVLRGGQCAYRTDWLDEDKAAA